MSDCQYVELNQTNESSKDTKDVQNPKDKDEEINNKKEA